MAEVYRAEHVGSLLRPPELLEARESHEAGGLSLERLRELEDGAILKALEMQREVGIEVFSDGEYRRSWFSGALAESVEGIIDDPDPGPVNPWQGPQGQLADETTADIGFTTQVVAAKLRQVRRLTAHESGFLKEHAPGPYKITMAGVMTRALGWYKPGLTDRFYPTPSALVQELVDMLQREVQALLEEGVTYIQLDSLRYVIELADVRRRQQMLQAGEDLNQALEDTIAVDNATLRNARRPGVTIAMHMCRGNNRSAWRSEGGYDVVAERAFSSLDVDRFLLEYDTERSGGFESLRFMPPDKVVVLGLISSKNPQLESQDQLLRHIDEAARYVPIENLALSPQCGFASTAPGNMLTPEEQKRKLELVVDTASKVWG